MLLSLFFRRSSIKLTLECYYLYSLEGALLNLHWNDIPSE
ncbi:hypothetical protein DXA83_26080, partial [Bacteroides thetaiotaomicron]